MAHVLQLVDETAAVAVSLSNGIAGYMDEYDPRTPDVTVAEYIGAGDGGELLSATQRNVTESARITVTGATTAIVQTNIQAIEKLLRQAERRQMGSPESAIYVQFTIDGGAGYRSEILTGRVELVPGVLAEWPNKKAEVLVIWTRRFYWEASAVSNLSMRSQTTPGPVGDGVTIENHDDSGHSNRVVITNADNPVNGVIPAPLLLRLKNTSGNGINYRNIYIAHYVERTATHNHTSFVQILEAEDNEVGGTTDTADANSSGAFYSALTWATSSAHTSTRWRWTITAAQMDMARGKYFRVLARFANTTHNSDSYVRFAVMPTVIPVSGAYTTPEVQLRGAHLEDLGVIRLPPGDGSLPDLTDHYLELTIRDSTGGTFDLDFLQLSPLDGWRHIKMLGGALGSNDVIEDHGTLRRLYVEEADGDTLQMLVGFGTPIHIVPNADQCLYVLVDEAASMTIARTLVATADYRARKITL